MQPALLHAGKRTASKRDSFIQVRQIAALAILSLSVVGLLAAPVPSNAPSTYPTWWFSRGVIVQTTPTNASPSWPTNYPTSDDYAAINEGELKNFATQAYHELLSVAPTNVWSTPNGQALANTVTNWSPTTGDDYQAMNLGQLKTVAAPFYGVLTNIGYCSGPPWTGSGADDYAVANIGQMKNVFSFDVGKGTVVDGVPDWWETHYFGGTGLASTNSVDGNGLTLGQDYNQGNDPTNYYSQNGQTITPTLTIQSGNSQSGLVGQALADPFVVKVTDSSGNPLENAPVTFMVTAGGGTLETSLLATESSSSELVTTASDGTAEVYFVGSYTAAADTISAQTAAQSVTFDATTTSFAPQVAAGGDEVLAISDLGQVQTWGNGIYTPTAVSGVGNVISASVGDGLNVSGNMFSVVAESDGSVWSWGSNSNGQLGDGTTTDESAPVQVVTAPSTPLTNIVAVAAGSAHTLALTSDGHVLAWGYNANGQLGNGGTTDSSVPTTISGLPQIKAISARYDSSFALDVDGNVWAWGQDNTNQLGDGLDTDNSTPTMVAGVSHITAISAGTIVVMALANDGTVWTWGDNSYGELGEGPDDPGDEGPIQVPNLYGVTSICAGELCCYAVLDNGTVWAWGYNNDGELGNGTTTEADSPTQVTAITDTGGTVQIVSVAATLDAAVALGSDGSVWTWGGNSGNYGELANDSNDGSLGPTMVPLGLIASSTDTNGNGIPDSWELQYFGSLVTDPYATAWGGESIIQAYQNDLVPITPALSVSGQAQTAPQSTFLASPIVATVTAATGGAPLPNAPVTFSNAGSYIGYFSTTLGGPASTSLTVNADGSGNAQAYYAGPPTAGVTNAVQIAVGSVTTNVSEITAATSGDLAAPSGVTSQEGTSAGQVVVNWTNNDTNSTYNIVQQSIDDTNWVSVAQVPLTNSYTITEANPNQSYYFGVISGAPSP